MKRGKLSIDANYVVLLNAQLTARNKLVIKQLSLGDKVAKSTASLPVTLAVDLLADRNGVIDLDLPFGRSRSMIRDSAQEPGRQNASKRGRVPAMENFLTISPLNIRILGKKSAKNRPLRDICSRRSFCRPGS